MHDQRKHILLYAYHNLFNRFNVICVYDTHFR